MLEVYQLDSSGHYQLRSPDELNRYYIEGMNLFVGTWLLSRENRTGLWLRWWNERGELLLWGSELAAQERQRAERLAAQLRAMGVEPEV